MYRFLPSNYCLKCLYITYPKLIMLLDIRIVILNKTIYPCNIISIVKLNCK